MSEPLDPNLAPDDEGERDRLLLAAMADVDAGHFVADEAVQAWIASLGQDLPQTSQHESTRPDRSDGFIDMATGHQDNQS